VAVAALDMTSSNPWSRLIMSDHANLHCLREMLRRQLHAARATVARNSQTKPSRTIVKGMSYVFFSFEFHNVKFHVH